jgi:hypothetical protein
MKVDQYPLLDYNRGIMEKYNWIVWKNNRIAGYVSAYSEWDAIRFARMKFGCETWVERTVESGTV